LLELSYPWATGLAIDGLIAHNFSQAIPIVAAWSMRAAIGCFRHMCDTRLYTLIYNKIIVETIIRQRAAGVSVTNVAARSAMARECVTFFETDVTMVIAAAMHIIGSAALPFWNDLIVGAWAALLFLPVILINRFYISFSSRLNHSLNNQLERETGFIDRVDPVEIKAHFDAVRSFRVKLSDALALNWTAVEVISIFVFIPILMRATVLPESDAGDIFAILVYVWKLMEGLDHVPHILQQLIRLHDISKRINEGASLDEVAEAVDEAARV
jgi:hypothetical protein